MRLNVEGLGPATVGIDAHGRSLYDEERQAARDRLPAILHALDVERERQSGRSRTDAEIGNVDE